MRITFSDQAKLDLREIGRFGIRVWGRDQTSAYLADLRAAITRLEAFPELGPVHRLDESGAIRRLVHWRHVVFYQYSDETINIARVLSVRAALPDTPGSGEQLKEL